MMILAIDTTTPSGSVALLRDETLLGEINLENASTHSARLFPAVDFLLRAHGLDIGAVDAFAVAAGPGSFTGIRIGVSAVKALAFASAKPVMPVSSLEALAAKLEGREVRLAGPILDAKKGEIYAALFEIRRGRSVELVPQGAYDPDEFFSRLPARRVISFAGSGVGLYREKLLTYVKNNACFPRRSLFIAAEVGRLGFAALAQGRGVSAAELQPLYFRKSQAEEKSLP